MILVRIAFACLRRPGVRRFLLLTIVLLTVYSSPVSVAEAVGQPLDILLIGDSLTAGMYFLYLSDATAQQGWAAHLLRRMHIPAALPRLARPYPIDHLSLVKDGFGLGGWRYAWSALPGLFSRKSLFDTGEARNVLGVPGRTVRELLTQSSLNPGRRSVAWILGARLLPPSATLIETAESTEEGFDWIVLWTGSNDLLASRDDRVCSSSDSTGLCYRFRGVNG